MSKPPEDHKRNRPGQSDEELPTVAERPTGAEDPTVAEGPTVSEDAALPSGVPAGSEGGELDDTIGTVTAEQPGRYTIQGVHGSGGQARVMLAFDAHIGREVALKELLPEKGRRESTSPWASPRSIPGVVRFLREARVTGQLEHPNIVPVYEVGRRQDGTLYYTMRLVRGQTLAQKLKECKGLQQRLQYLGVFWDVCKAVAYAHSRGVVHRDIKPSNIMVGEFEETVLLDWGIAKVRGKRDIGARDIKRELRLLADDKIDRTSAGATMGTPSYMSPEQARGEIENIDERSDVWGLGAVLYEILTGHPPHEGRTRQEIVVRAGRQPVRPVQERCPEAPAELAAIATKALHRDPRKRYQSARAMADDVRAYMTGEKVAAYNYSTWELIRRFAAQHKALLASLLAVLVVLVGALISVSLSLRAELAARRAEQAALERERTARHREHREHLMANLHLARAYADRAERALAQHRHSEARVLAIASLHHNPAHPGSPFFDRDFAAETPQASYWRVEAASKLYRLRFLHQAELQWSLAGPDVLTGLALAPDGSRGAVGSYDGSIVVFDTSEGRQLLRISGHRNRVYQVAFSPDGSRLASGGQDTTVRLWRSDDGRALEVFTGHRAAVRAVAFSPDGRTLASVAEDGVLRLWPVAGTGGNVWQLGHGPLHALAFHPGGRLLAVGTEDGRVIIQQRGRSNRRQVLVLSDKPIYTVAFSPDGKTLLAGGDDRLLHLWSVDKRRELRRLAGHGDGILSATFSADGRWLASAGYDRTLRLWNATTGNILLELVHPGFVFSTRLLGSATFLASAGYDRTLRLFRITAGERLERLLGHQGTIYGLAVARDRNLLATAGWDREIRLWDLDSRRLLRVLRGHENVIDSLAFSPDGSLLASASRDATVRLWQAGSGKLVATLRGHSDVAYGVGFSPDGRRLASCGMGGRIIVWDVASGGKLLELHPHQTEFNSVAFSPDGRLLAAAGNDRLVRLFDSHTGDPLRVLAGHRDWTSSVAFSPDGRLLVSSGKDAQVIVWEVASGKRLGQLVGHRQWVNTVRFSADGKLLATGSDDRSVRLWSVENFKPLLKIPASSEVVAVDFLPGGRKLAVGDGKQVVLYPVDFSTLEIDTGPLLEQAREAAGMNVAGWGLEAGS